MPKQPSPIDPALLWKQQPEEPSTVVPPNVLAERTVELYASSRSEILGSLCAATLFVVVIGWRLASAHDMKLWLTLALIALWVAITAWRSRRLIRDREVNNAAALAVSGLDYYQAELVRRLAHLNSGWLWHGPLILACATLCVVAARTGGITLARFGGVVPLLIVLAGWVAMRNFRRWRQIQKIRQEIEEVRLMRASDGSGQPLD